MESRKFVSRFVSETIDRSSSSNSSDNFIYIINGFLPA